MTTLELKTRIQLELENAPENLLLEVLDLIHSKQKSPEQIQRDINFKKILSEDKELLNRLAQ